MKSRSKDMHQYDTFDVILLLLFVTLKKHLSIEFMLTFQGNSRFDSSLHISQNCNRHHIYNGSELSKRGTHHIGF